MKVLVTGGSGFLGRWVVRELLGAGHEPLNVDRRPPEQKEAPYREADLRDVGQVAGAMKGRDAVVHLGAIPAPDRHSDEVVFANNVRATFAVLQAASLVGVRRAVVASSLSALGTAYALHPFSPLYAPGDEEHPLLGQDPYALSKEVDERTSEMFHRGHGMQVLAYRFHAITSSEGAARSAAALRDNPQTGAHLLWGYVEVRNAARACRLGIEADGLGFESFNITAADTLSETPTERLIRRYCRATELRASVPGTASGFSIQKARRLLGYAPKHSWRTEPKH